MLKHEFLYQDYDDDALMFEKVAILCKEDFFKSNTTFSSNFEHGCQEKIASIIKILVSTILYGLNSSTSMNNSQACLTMAQLFEFVHNFRW